MGLWDVIEPVLDKAESFPELFFQVSWLLSNHNRVVFVWNLWSIWRRQNTMLWEDRDETYVQVSLRAMHAMEDSNREVILGKHVHTANH